MFLKEIIKGFILVLFSKILFVKCSPKRYPRIPPIVKGREMMEKMTIVEIKMIFFIILCPRPDSNGDFRLRKPVFFL